MKNIEEKLPYEKPEVLYDGPSMVAPLKRDYSPPEIMYEGLITVRAGSQLPDGVMPDRGKDAPNIFG